MVRLRLSAVSLFSVLASALEGHTSPLRRQAPFSTLSASQIAAFKPFTFYASMAYCKPAAVLSRSCGANCQANPTFIPVASGGDGIDIQFWYVGYDPVLQTVIVGHQGTDPSKIVPLLTDADFFLTPLSQKLFPGTPSSIEVHNGFAEEHAKQKALAQSKLKKVTLVGHSLGAALSLLESVYLPLFIPGVTFRMIGYGLPRVGNQAFASYIDSHVTIDHINNKEDVVPILPGRFLGFHHPGGEKHIQDDNSWTVCAGDDNTDKRCSTGDVANIFEGKVSEHDGKFTLILVLLFFSDD
ncbi:hypothetical protein D9619_006732 [Psilocybe cf. subviscida]|uniref:Fungal lipase-type domain-containing protein n=1 Tax=Psilocybe cf. subviscida TaxID=2480587 RepID=A0A8H5B4F8_9AGAR|nr:hypothetical protein D9619_006732 [Psilocybe cf. subviscida]